MPNKKHTRRRIPLLASDTQAWMEALVWLDGGNPATRGSWSLTYGVSPRRTQTNGSSRPEARPQRLLSRRSSVASSASTYLRQTVTESPTMNKYGLIAQEHWKKHAPNRYATLTDPASHFQSLGESAATQIDQIAATLEAQLDPDLPYLERVGQMNAIRLQAEEAVLNDLVFSVESEQTDLTSELEQMLGDLPSPPAILTAIDRIHEAAEDEAEQEHSSTPILSEEQERRVAQLTTLLPLVTLEREPDEMTEAALRDRILALRPFWNPESRSLATP